MDRPDYLALLTKLERAHVYAMNAQRRGFAHTGTETARKAFERADHWQEEFDRALAALRNEKDPRSPSPITDLCKG